MKTDSVVIEFPLRGEWHVPTTPAKRIPSHGTNRMGLRYAFDFMQIDYERTEKPFHNYSPLKGFFFGVPLENCYCWGQAIYAPCDGEVVTIENGVKERKRVHWLIDSLIAVKHGLFFNEKKDSFQKIAGNFVVIKFEEHGYMAFVHLQKDSIQVSLHEKLKKGMLLGRVGHSGNSTSPHLHFQLMDSRDIANAHGISCAFKEYEVYREGQWLPVYKQIPSDTDRIRFVEKEH